MKKLAIMFLSLAFLGLGGGVAMACPHHEEKAADDNAPKTAEKAKTEKKQDDKAKADKTKTAKPAEKTTEKKPEKVSKK